MIDLRYATQNIKGIYITKGTNKGSKGWWMGKNGTSYHGFIQRKNKTFFEIKDEMRDFIFGYRKVEEQMKKIWEA